MLAGLTREYGYDRAGNLIGERCGREALGYRLDACGRVLETLKPSFMSAIRLRKRMIRQPVSRQLFIHYVFTLRRVFS